MKVKTPSIAQARRIAEIWGKGGRTRIVDARPDGTEFPHEPTTRICISKGWLMRDGVLHEMESGYFQRDYVVSIKGLDALEGFLRETRLKTAFKSVNIHKCGGGER